VGYNLSLWDAPDAAMGQRPRLQAPKTLVVTICDILVIPGGDIS